MQIISPVCNSNASSMDYPRRRLVTFCNWDKNYLLYLTGFAALTLEAKPVLTLALAAVTSPVLVLSMQRVFYHQREN